MPRFHLYRHESPAAIHPRNRAKWQDYVVNEDQSSIRLARDCSVLRPCRHCSVRVSCRGIVSSGDAELVLLLNCNAANHRNSCNGTLYGQETSWETFLALSRCQTNADENMDMAQAGSSFHWSPALHFLDQHTYASRMSSTPTNSISGPALGF